MKGVSMIRTTFRAHAYCLGILEGDEAIAACPFQRQDWGAVGMAAVVRNDAQRHVRETGHTVYVDVVDRTDYAPMPSREPADVTR